MLHLAFIEYTPPGLFHLGPITTNVHGLFFSIGMLVAYFWTYYRTPKVYREHLSNLVVWMSLAGLLGARALYCLAHWHDYLSAPWSVLYFWEGGLISYGGLIGAVLAWIAYIRRAQLPLPLFAQALGPAGLLAWGVGRIGCLLNWGVEYGTVTDVPWAFVVNGDAPRHPVMLYLVIAHVTMALLLNKLSDRWQLNAAPLCLMSYGGMRFILDYWRPYQAEWLHWGAACFNLALFLLGWWLLKRLPYANLWEDERVK